MRNDQSNPWVDRYIPLLDQDFIKERARVRPQPVGNLYEINIELACRRLKDTLHATFYPTRQCIEILQRLVGVTYAHAVETYPSKQAFISKIYAEEKDPPGFAKPICLTGLSGIGKSEILNALNRIAGQETSIQVDPHHPPFLIKGPRLLTLKTLSTPIQIAKSLFNVDVNADTLASQCRKKAFRDGIPFFMIDESQFATSSSTANARITQILLSLSYIQIPFIFSANYSLLHRLLLRPEEDRQRLISDPIFLVPDSWSSDCWIHTLEALLEAASNVLNFDPVKDAKKIHAWTAGRKRALIDLITFAFRNQHPYKKVVDIRSLENAFRSAEFTDYRNDSETISNQTTLKQPNQKRKELWCPIPTSKIIENQFSDEATSNRDELVAEIELKSSLTSSERQAIQEIDLLVNNKKDKRNSTKSHKNEKQTSQNLLENAARFRESLSMK